jgi:hypothetical protein
MKKKYSGTSTTQILLQINILQNKKTLNGNLEINLKTSLSEARMKQHTQALSRPFGNHIQTHKTEPNAAVMQKEPIE